MDGTPGKTDNNSSAPCNNAEKKTPSTKITNEILTEEELKKATDNDEERTTAVNSEITPAKYSEQVMTLKTLCCEQYFHTSTSGKHVQSGRRNFPLQQIQKKH